VVYELFGEMVEPAERVEGWGAAAGEGTFERVVGGGFEAASAAVLEVGGDAREGSVVEFMIEVGMEVGRHLPAVGGRVGAQSPADGGQERVHLDAFLCSAPARSRWSRMRFRPRLSRLVRVPTGISRMAAASS